MSETPRACDDCFEIYWVSKLNPDKICPKCREKKDDPGACCMLSTLVRSDHLIEHDADCPEFHGKTDATNLPKSEKLKMIEEHFAKERAASPDGKTSWDRVEEYRLKHGHLPPGSGKDE